MIEEWQVDWNKRYIETTANAAFRWLVQATYYIGVQAGGKSSGYWFVPPTRNITCRFYPSYGTVKVELNDVDFNLRRMIVNGEDPFIFQMLGRYEDMQLAPTVILNTANGISDLVTQFFPGSQVTTAVAVCYGCSQLPSSHWLPLALGDSSLEGSPLPVRICRCVGDKWLCDDCQDRFSLPVPNAAEADNEKKVHPERAKMTVTLRFDVLARDRFACKTCGRSPLTEDGVKLHVDHIYPVSLGGKTEMDNLQALCDLCNLGKSNKVVEQLTLGI